MDSGVILDLSPNGGRHKVVYRDDVAHPVFFVTNWDLKQILNFLSKCELGRPGKRQISHLLDAGKDSLLWDVAQMSNILSKM